MTGLTMDQTLSTHSVRTESAKGLGIGPICTGNTLVLVCVLLSLISGLGYLVMNKAQQWPLRELVLEGSLEKVSADEIRKVLLPALGQGFFAMDVRQIRRQVESIPWVRQANVTRVWPYSLKVSWSEQEIVARWGDEGGINQFGEWVPVSGESLPRGLPHLKGTVNSLSQVVANYLMMTKSIRPLGLKIVELGQDERWAWNSTLDNGIRLVLGRHDELNRFRRFVDYYPAISSRNGKRIQRVDLRYENGFSVQWHEHRAKGNTGLSKEALFRNGKKA